MLHDARRTTISAPNGHEQGECDVRPLIICLDFLGGETPDYSVAIAFPLYEVWCISAPPWIGNERRFFSLSSATGNILAYGSTLKYYKCKDRLKWYKTLKLDLENDSINW